MSKLLIRQVRYYGQEYIYESPILREGVNILEGENGSGKTTFSSLIYFGLGGSVKWFNDGNKAHTEIVNDNSNYTEISFEISGIPYLATRYFSGKEIHIVSPDDVKSLPINRSEKKPVTFSDWLLNKLDIKVVDIYQGSEDYKINFYDLSRLFYYDQLTEPDRIFKRPDNENFITDSIIIKKAIFEILNGNAFDDFYESISEYRRAQDEFTSIKSLLQNFNALNADSNKNYENKNSFNLSNDFSELVEQRQKLEDYRNTIKDNLTTTNSDSELLARSRNRYSALEEKRNTARRQKEDLIYDYSRVNRLHSSLILEVTQLKKIMITNEKLNLFSPNTCPYCLTEVKKQENKCICGSDVNEEQYQKFFYSKEEYFRILNSKQKNIETVNHAISSYEEEIDELNDRIGHYNFQLTKLDEDIIAIQQGQKTVRNVEIREINDKILETEKEIVNLKQQIKIEKKREKLQQQVDQKQIEVSTKRRNMESLKISASKDMDEIKNLFNSKYYSMMQKSLSDCRAARIGEDDYMPIINSGAYTEASSNVSKRITYFFTLLHLSLVKNTNFPKFLLIDTPENIGIDDDNLIKILSLIDEIGQGENKEKEYQIILTTGENKYPSQFKKDVFQKLTKKKRLLNKRSINPHA